MCRQTRALRLTLHKTPPLVFFWPLLRKEYTRCWRLKFPRTLPVLSIQDWYSAIVPAVAPSDKDMCQDSSLDPLGLVRCRAFNCSRDCHIPWNRVAWPCLGRYPCRFEKLAMMVWTIVDCSRRAMLALHDGTQASARRKGLEHRALEAGTE